MNKELQDFLFYIEKSQLDLNINRDAAKIFNCKAETIEIFDKIISLNESLKDKSIKGDLKVNYLNQFQSNIETILNHLPIRGYKDANFINHQNDHWKESNKQRLDKNSDNFKRLYSQIQFNIDFFDKIEYFSNNVVAIGANGSGKTSLSNKFKSYLQNNGVVISAQRILLVPNFNGISNPETTANELKQTQIRDKSNKNASEINHLIEEFSVILKNLLADNISAGNNYRKHSLNQVSQGLEIQKPQRTNLDLAFEIWNNLIEHRTIECEDGINITAKDKYGRIYPAIQMSDGEKVMLYLIAQVLQAPKDGFIVVDEPEMYLHKTVLKKLWNELEIVRDDCLFIYLTHDLDFATSRSTAKKIWIKSFNHPDKWEIEDITTNEIPESLLLELLGSRKNILFCEGLKGSIDEKLFTILFPKLTIIPVASCFDVINHTKAFNKLNNVDIRAFGIVDSDHHDHTRLDKLKESLIYSFQLAEVENIFLDENFLNIAGKILLVENTEIEEAKKDVLKELNKLKEIQASNYVSAKINYFFSDSDVSKGNALPQLEKNYSNFLNKISIKEWYDVRIKELDQIVESSNYNEAIKVFNHKGLKKIISNRFNITDYIERSLKIIQKNEQAKKVIFEYFPEEIKTAGNIG